MPEIDRPEVGHDVGQELIPAPWSLTEREKHVLENTDFESFPSRFKSDLRRARDRHGIEVETEAFERVLCWRRARADLKKAIREEREEDLKLEKLEGEEIEIAKLRRENFHLKTEVQKAVDAAAKEQRLKEAAIAGAGR